MAFVILKLNVVKLKIVNGPNCVGALKRELGKVERDFFDLLLDCFEMVLVNVAIPDGVGEAAGEQSGHPAHQMDQQGVAGYVKGNPQPQVGRSLVQLAV